MIPFAAVLRKIVDSISVSMMWPKLKWLIVIQLLLTDYASSQTSVLPSQLLHNIVIKEEEKKQEQMAILNGSPLNDGLQWKDKEEVLVLNGGRKEKEIMAQSAQNLVETITEMLQGRMPPISLQGKVSCKELLAAATLDKSPALFPRELLGLTLVPVLVASGCPQGAQTVVLQLYELLGGDDTKELLLDLEDLMKRRRQHRAAASLLPMAKDQEERHLQAIMFNIEQLASSGEILGYDTRGSGDKWPRKCQGWTKVNGTLLLGEVVDGERGRTEAMHTCENLGPQCAGVSPDGSPGRYRAILRKGSSIVPSTTSDCWIHKCMLDQEKSSSPRRIRRSPQSNCVNKREERVFNVVEWIPTVSTLYSLGTAVYYASVNCSETAKERAILSAVDLGTDALMAVTGGTAGVASYAMGAGVKTGVKAGIKYLLNTMKQEDLIVNQNTWSTFTTDQ